MYALHWNPLWFVSDGVIFRATFTNQKVLKLDCIQLADTSPILATRISPSHQLFHALFILVILGSLDYWFLLILFYIPFLSLMYGWALVRPGSLYKKVSSIDKIPQLVYIEESQSLIEFETPNRQNTPSLLKTWKLLLEKHKAKRNAEHRYKIVKNMPTSFFWVGLHIKKCITFHFF